MRLVAVHRRSESDTPWGAPQAPCNCGRKNEGETIQEMKPESKRLNDPMYNLDVAHPGADENRAIHKQIKSQRCFGNNSPVSIVTSKVVKHFRMSGIYFKIVSV